MKNKPPAPPSGSRTFRAYAEFIVRHRFAVIAAILVVTGLLMSRMGSLQVDSDPNIWAPPAHPYVKTTKQIEAIFGGKNVTVVGIVPHEGDIYQPKVLAKIKRIQEEVEQLPMAVRHNILSLAARKVKTIRGTADGMEVKQMMETVPQTPEEMAKLRAAVASMPIYINSLVSPDGRSAAVVADFKDDQKNPNFTAMVAGLRQIVEKERDGTVDIYLGGLPMLGAWSEFYFMKMPMYFGVALLIVMAIQFWSFRSVQGMLLPMLTGVLSVLWSLGLMGLIKVHIDPLNTTTPILVLAIAAGHAIQILKRYYEEFHRARAAGIEPHAANRVAVIESMVRVGPVMLTAALISIITFYSLAATGIPMVQHFGIFAGGGVLSAIVIEMTIIPALRSALRAPKPKESAREQQEGILDRFLASVARNLVGGRAPWIVGAGVVVLLAVTLGVTSLHVDNNFKTYFKEHSEVRTDDDKLNDRFGGTNSILFLVDTHQHDGLKDPAVLRGIANLQAFLETQPNVGKTQSIVDLLRRMNQSMHSDDPKTYTVPETRDLVAQYLFLYSLSGDPQDFDSFVDNDYQKASVWVFIKSSSTAYADELARKANAVIAQSLPSGVTVQMGGSLPQIMALNEVIIEDKLRNLIQMAIVVFVLSAIVLRSFVGGFFVLTPLVAVIGSNFGLMGWLGIPLDITAVSIAGMAIGIGADYEIYLLFRFREELARTGNVLAATRESLRTSGKAILFVALSVIGGYAVLQTSGFAFYINLSTLVSATMVVSTLIALFFLRALMMVFKPKFVFGEQRDAYFDPAVLAQPEAAK